MFDMNRPWQEIADEQQRLRDSQIPREWLLKDLPPTTVTNVMDVPYTCGIMTPEELALTEKDATELLGMIATGELKSAEVTLAFCKRAAIAQQLVNCLTSIYFDEALERAKELDLYFETHGKTVGPYHGLPISIKDQFNVKGKVSSSGYLAWINNVAEEDAKVVKIVRDAGAVFFCKTNNPQTLMHLETNSNVHGRTLNPYNRNLTAGGSSGGEGALVAFRGSPMGLTTDGGGSTRVPAANNGLFGHKPSSNRVPLAGCTLTMRGCDSFPVVAAPVTRSARDIEYFMKVVLGSEPWKTEPELVPLPWRPTELPLKIKIGIYSDDGVVRPHPPITHAISVLKEKLSNLSNVEVVEWTPWKHDEGYDIIRQLYFQDGGKENLDIMASTGEPILPLSEWIFKPSHTKPRTIQEGWELQYKRDTFRRAYLENWNSHPDAPDFIVGPVGPSAAPRHDTAKYWGYSAIFNLLDYPACTFPTGLVCDPKVHPLDTTYRPRDNEFDGYNWGNYDAEIFQGAPISLQVTGRKWDCERVLKAADFLSKVMAS